MATEYKFPYTASEINEKFRKIDELDIGSNKIYTQNEEPADAPDGTLWVDMDEESPVLKIKNNGAWEEVAGVSGHTHTTSDITDFPTSLPADGGNADTLDGKHADEFVLVSDFNQLDISTDDTLTKSGKAADAAVVGSALATKITSPATATVGQVVIVKTVDEDGVPTEWEAGDVSTSSNWDTMENKPFGEYEGYTDLLPLTTYSGFVLHTDFGVYGTAQSAGYALTIDKEYTVSWDDGVHECAAQDANSVIPNGIVLGNASQWGLSGNNEPFVIALLPDGIAMYASLLDTTSGGIHSVCISEKQIIVRQIDAKYIPLDIIDTRIEEYISAALGGDY